MIIEIEWGWLRVGDYALSWAGETGARSEERLPGDPWFEWRTDRPRDGSAKGTGTCWLGQLQILWEHPTREWREAQLSRLQDQPSRLAAEVAGWEAEDAARAAAGRAAEAAWSSEFGIPLPASR